MIRLTSVKLQSTLNHKENVNTDQFLLGAVDLIKKMFLFWLFRRLAISLTENTFLAVKLCEKSLSTSLTSENKYQSIKNACLARLHIMEE